MKKKSKFYGQSYTNAHTITRIVNYNAVISNQQHEYQGLHISLGNLPNDCEMSLIAQTTAPIFQKRGRRKEGKKKDPLSTAGM